MSISVVIVDDHDVVRLGLVNLLSDPDIGVVGQTGTTADALQLIAEHHPQVAMIDVRLGGEDGLELLDRIREASPETRVVIFSAYDNPTYVARAITMGASDYLLKGTSRADLLGSIKAIAAGDASRQSELYRRTSSVLRSTSGGVAANPPLTTREAQVLRHLALGLSNKEIGRSLDISVETVKEHVQNVLRKMQVVDRTQAAVEAVKQGLIN